MMSFSKHETEMNLLPSSLSCCRAVSDDILETDEAVQHLAGPHLRDLPRRSPRGRDLRDVRQTAKGTVLMIAYPVSGVLRTIVSDDATKVGIVMTTEIE